MVKHINGGISNNGILLSKEKEWAAHTCTGCIKSIRPEMGHTAAPRFHTETLPPPLPSPSFLIRGLAHPSSLLSPSVGTFVGAVSTKMDHSVGHSLHYQYNSNVKLDYIKNAHKHLTWEKMGHRHQPTESWGPLLCGWAVEADMGLLSEAASVPPVAMASLFPHANAHHPTFPLLP